MEVEQAEALITLLRKKQFAKSYFVQDGEIYYGVGVLSEDPLFVAQCQWKNDLLYDVVYIVDVGNGDLLGAYRFESGVLVDELQPVFELPLDTIDFDEHGSRWEGRCLDGVPFGFGCMYDENGDRTYSGFCFNGEFSCYGSFLFLGMDVDEYTGMLYKGKRCGHGTLYDREHNIVFSGEWLDGKCACTHSFTPTNSLSLVGVNSLLTVLEVGNNACNSLSALWVNELNRLQRITIGSDCFANVEVFQISLPLLESLTIKNRSFSTVKQGTERRRSTSRRFSVASCPKLASIHIGSFSFADYYHFEIHDTLPTSVS